MDKRSFLLIILVPVNILWSLMISSQPLGVKVSGLVRDSLTHEPIPYAAVTLKGPEIHGLTDEKGQFRLYTTRPFTHYYVTSIGYEPKTLEFATDEGNSVTIDMNPEGLLLEEVTVRKTKEHYSKKNNPAVALMQKIRESDDQSNPLTSPYYSYDKYERIRLGLNDFNPTHHHGMMSRFPFLTDYVDTSAITGKPILNLSTREKLSRMYFRAQPSSKKSALTRSVMPVSMI